MSRIHLGAALNVGLTAEEGVDRSRSALQQGAAQKRNDQTP